MDGGQGSELGGGSGPSMGVMRGIRKRCFGPREK